jgi:hypothetical protein
LDHGQATKVDGRALEGRIAKIEAVRRAATGLPDAYLTEPALPESQSLLDRTNHYDFGRAICDGDGGAGEGAKHVDYGDRAGRSPGTFEKALDDDFHLACPDLVEVHHR